MGERATRWLTVSETARRLSMSASGIRKKIAAGVIPCAHIGRSLRIDFPELERQLEAEIRRMKDLESWAGRAR